MNTPLLTIEKLHVSVEDKEILHGVDLTIGADETHVLMGPNGTGKSTLGCAITGSPAYTVTAGRILFGGEDITATHIDYAIDKIIAQDGKTGKHDTVWLNREVMGL